MVVICGQPMHTNNQIEEPKNYYSPPEIYLKTTDALQKFAKDLKGAVPPWTTFK